MRRFCKKTYTKKNVFYYFFLINHCIIVQLSYIEFYIKISFKTLQSGLNLCIVIFLNGILMDCYITFD